NRQEQHDEAGNLYPAALYGSLQLLTAIAVLVAIASPVILKVLASGFDARKLELSRTLLLFMLPLVPLSGLNNTWRTVLNSNERFLMAAFAPVLLPLATICSLLAFGGGWGIYTLAAATLGGAILQSATLALAVHYGGYAPVP